MQTRQTEEFVNSLLSKNMDIANRLITHQGGKIWVLYIRQLTDWHALSSLVIKPLVDASDARLNAEQAQNLIYADDCHLAGEENEIEMNILKGNTVVLFSGSSRYLVVNVKKTESRAIPEPDLTYTQRGPRDSFVENLDINLSLVRYRVKDANLKIEFLEIGERTKTRVAVLYISDIANEQSVAEIKKRISAIKTDGFMESGELQAFMLNKTTNLFPQMGIVERSDVAGGALLEGKVVALVEGNALGLIAPKVFTEFLWARDEDYDNKYIGLFVRLLRIIALLLSFTISSFYVAIISFHSDILPAEYIIALAQLRARVPFNALVEVLLIEIVSDLLREALGRAPKKFGTAIGIVGATIIGQAAIAAGIFSPLLLIVVALSLICSFIPGDYTIANTFRILKFPLILASGTFGFFGFTLVILLVVGNLVSINTFGIPYMAPLSPFNWKDFLKNLFYSKSMATNRPHFMRTKNAKRTNK